MRIAIYKRVSTDKQNMQSQDLTIKNYINSLEKRPFYKYFEDTGSGSKIDRSQYQQLKNELINGKFDLLLMYSIDRLARDSDEIIKTIMELKSLGIQIKCLNPKESYLDFTDNNPFANTFLAMFADIAQLERNKIRDRVKKGLEAAKKKGIKLGRKGLEDSLVNDVINSIQAGDSKLKTMEHFKISQATYYRIRKTIQQTA